GNWVLKIKIQTSAKSGLIVQLVFRIKRNLEAAQEIVLRSRAKCGNEPALILEERINAPLGTHLPKEPRGGIALSASTRQEHGTGLNITISKLQAGGGRKMISAQGMVGPSVAPGRVAEQKALVQIGIVITEIPVQELSSPIS